MRPLTQASPGFGAQGGLHIRTTFFLSAYALDLESSDSPMLLSSRSAQMEVGAYVNLSPF